MRIEHYSAQELFRQLNDVDETANVEAKALSKDSSRSIMETVCSFSNEPGLGGGVILLGVAENDKAHGTPYVVEGIDDTDKAQLDFASQCATMFNRYNAETLQGNAKTLQGNTETLQARLQDLMARPAIAQALSRLKKHTKRRELERIIVDICNDEPLKSVELAGLLKRNETYLRGVLSNMVGEKGPLSYTIPEMPTHPNQSVV